jgi:DNA-binding transcriptional LysR family regulator
VLTLVELAVVAGLARGATLRQIAEEVGLTQPAVTKVLRGLERRLGLALAERRGRRLALTPAGEHLATLGRPVLELAARAEQGMAAYRAGRAGRVMVAATSTPGNYLLPAVVGAFLRAWPEADLALIVTHLEETWALLRAGQADVAVIAGEQAPPPFICEPLYEEEIVLCVGPTHPLAGEPPPTWARLAREPLVTSQSETTWQEMLRRLGAVGFQPAREIEVRAVEGLKRLVETGFGVGLAFRRAVARELELGLLCAVPSPGPARPVPFALAYHSERAFSPVLARFVAALRAAAGCGRDTSARRPATARERSEPQRARKRRAGSSQD